MSLVAELRRRNVIRIAGFYLVAAWLIVQVAGTVLPMFDAPPWIARVLVVLLAIGFVPAVAFAWVYELTTNCVRPVSKAWRQMRRGSGSGRHRGSHCA